MKKTIKNTIVIIMLLFLLFISLLVYATNYIYNLALDPTTDKSMFMEHLDQTVTAIPDVLFDVSKEVSVTSHDDLQLHGYTFSQDSDTWVIVVHGYLSEGIEMGWAIRHFYRMGHNVLVPDLRGHGRSEGNYIAMGWDDRLDILKWIDYLVEQDSESQIILYGISMGGAAVMNAGGETLPNNVKVIIEDSAYTNTADIFTYHLEHTFEMPEFPLLGMASWVTKLRAGFSIKDGPINQLRYCTLPILFIHGENDMLVPIEQKKMLYDSYQGPKEKLIVPNAGHVQANDVDVTTYWETINTFITTHLN
jgi:Dipeptidyl aminopeptidases/acylaminoacyl-peptidases